LPSAVAREIPDWSASAAICYSNRPAPGSRERAAHMASV
jgi:hypothetical protein